METLNERDTKLKLVGLPILANHNNNNTLSTVREVSITDCEVDELGAIRLASTLEGNPNLTSVEVYCPPNALRFAKLADATKKLTKLKIWKPSDLEFDEDYRPVEDLKSATYSLGLSHLLSSLKCRNNLTVFSVHDFVWNVTQLELFGFLLDETLTLERLSLDFLEGEKLNDDAWVAFAACIGSFSTLKHLFLNICDFFGSISDNGIHRGHAELVASPSLASYVCWFGASSSLLCGLIPMLDVQRSIRELTFPRADYNVESGKDLVEVLRANYTLTHVKIGNLHRGGKTE